MLCLSCLTCWSSSRRAFCSGASKQSMVSFEKGCGNRRQRREGEWCITKLSPPGYGAWRGGGLAQGLGIRLEGGGRAVCPPPPQEVRSPCQQNYPADAHPSPHQSVLESANPAWTRSVHLDAPGQRHGQQPVSRTADPGVVKQDKSSWGSVDTTKTRSDPQRVRMSSGESPIGTAKGKQPDTEALCQPPPPPPTPQGPAHKVPTTFQRLHTFGWVCRKPPMMTVRCAVQELQWERPGPRNLQQTVGVSW